MIVSAGKGSSIPDGEGMRKRDGGKEGREREREKKKKEIERYAMNNCPPRL